MICDWIRRLFSPARLPVTPDPLPSQPLSASPSASLAPAERAFYQPPVRPKSAGDALPVSVDGYGRKHSSSGVTWAVDVSLPQGWRVRAIGDGEITRTSDDQYNGIGAWLRLTDPDGPWYGKTVAVIHLSALSVRVGDKVRAGDILGISGNTGASTGPHVHFEVSDMSDPMDPTVIGWADHGWNWAGY